MDILTIDRKLQDEEIEILRCVYEDQFKIIDEINRSYSVDITEDKKTATLFIKFPADYPTNGPPLYQLSVPYLNKDEKELICSQIEECYLNNIGEPVCLLWIGILKDFLNKKYSNAQDNNNFPAEKIEEKSQIELAPIFKPRYNVIHGDSITDRKSVFQGHLVFISSVKDVKEVLLQLRQNKKIANATHNIYAYRIKGDKGNIMQDCEDDGETRAGGRLLHLLKMMDVFGVLVIVSRWYGGILLGPDRFKHICNAAKQVMLTAGVNIKK